MSKRLDRSAIGVDGGGTNCRFALLHGGNRFDVRLDAANASTDLEGTYATLKLGLTKLAEAARLTKAELAQIPAFMGLAGMMNDTTANDIANRLPLVHLRVEDDRRTAMVGALGGFDGCVIGIGTGSFFGRRHDGRDRLIGGWGPVLADDASGAILGRHLLRSALDVHDGLHAPSPATEGVFARFGSAAAIVAFASKAKPGEFAELAPRVVQSAQDGDVICIDLMTRGADYIKSMLRGLGWQPGERICPIGGLAPHYAPFLPPDIADQLTAPEGTALDGALALAAQMTPMGEMA